MTKSGKKLFVIGLLIIVAAIVYFFIIKPNGSPFGFGSISSNYATPIDFKLPSSDNNCIGQPTGQTAKLVTGASDASTTLVKWDTSLTTDTQKLAVIPPVNTSAGSSKINMSTFTTFTPNILWLFPTKSAATSTSFLSNGIASNGDQMFDTFLWPSGISPNYLSSAQLTIFNWYMNQDSINTYMSDIDLDIDYNNLPTLSTDGDIDSLNPEKPGGAITPPEWTATYIKQTIGRALYGIQHKVSAAAGTDKQTGAGGGAGTSTTPNGASGTYNSNQIARTNNFVTVIANYTNLYSYICGYSNLSDTSKTGYGLANIKVGTTSTAITDSYYSKNNIKIGTENVGIWQGKSGAFNDCAFYSNGSNTEKKQSDYVLDGRVKHAIWSVLLARQNQLIGRLEPNIVKTL
jgi:hypothetical protein